MSFWNDDVVKHDTIKHLKRRSLPRPLENQAVAGMDYILSSDAESDHAVTFCAKYWGGNFSLLASNLNKFDWKR